MPNGDAHSNGVWKWIASTLGGVMIGAIVVSMFSSYQIQKLIDRVDLHEKKRGHYGIEVLEVQMIALENIIEDLSEDMREAIAKMDRYHQPR